jgi:hypothetical protein
VARESWYFSSIPMIGKKLLSEPDDVRKPSLLLRGVLVFLFFSGLKVIEWAHS